MERKPITLNMAEIPDEFRSLIKSANLYDSSCSKTAQVIFIDKDQGYYLKSATKGDLRREAELTRFFHSKDLAAEVLSYRSEERDWLLTARVPGEDCTYGQYLEEPKRLCDILAEQLLRLHSLDFSDCPVNDRISEYIKTAEENYHSGQYDKSQFPDSFGYSSAEEAWKTASENRHLLKRDALLHGDYCLPNIILNNWKFSGFIDLGNGGVGDRHIDLFWGAWSLAFNLKTDKYIDRFFDAYGRSNIDTQMLRIVAAYEVFG